MVKQQRSTAQSRRHCLGVEKSITKRNLATEKSHGNNTWTRWRNKSRKGKNGLRHVRSPRIRTRTPFFSIFLIFLSLVLGNVRYPFPQIDVLMILTTFQPTVSEPISNKMTKGFNQLMPPNTLDAHFVPLQHVANVIAIFKMIQINRQNCNKNFDSFVQQRET